MFDWALNTPLLFDTAQKMKPSIQDFFSKLDQICRWLRIWSHLLKKLLIKSFISYAVSVNTDHKNSSILNSLFASWPI